jgi:cytoskeletal protein RodZ
MPTPHDGSSIGQRLSEARLARGLSLTDVERQTRIARRYLQAFEADQWDVLPAPVYARGFLRNYARFLGLDDKELLAGVSFETQTPHVLPVVRKQSNTGLIWVIVVIAFGLGVILWAFIALGAFQAVGDVVDDITGDDSPTSTPIVATPAPSFSCADLQSDQSLTAEEQAWFTENCATPTPEPPTEAPYRTDCEAIRGTDYESAEERDYFLENCLTPPAGG